MVDDLSDIDKSNKKIIQNLNYGEMSQRELIQLWNNNLDKKYKILGVIKENETNVNVKIEDKSKELNDMFKEIIELRKQELKAGNNASSK